MYNYFFSIILFLLQLWITIYQCRQSSDSGQCNENPTKHIEPLHCDRFHADDSGPWFMLASAMKGARCGELNGEFQLDTATLKPEYLTNYLKFDESMPTYRIQMLFHRIGNSEASERLHVRGCVNLEFDLIY